MLQKLRISRSETIATIISMGHAYKLTKISITGTFVLAITHSSTLKSEYILWRSIGQFSYQRLLPDNSKLLF
jgi:hypothetical protein